MDNKVSGLSKILSAKGAESIMGFGGKRAYKARHRGAIGLPFFVLIDADDDAMALLESAGLEYMPHSKAVPEYYLLD